MNSFRQNFWNLPWKRNLKFFSLGNLISSVCESYQWCYYHSNLSIRNKDKPLLWGKFRKEFCLLNRVKLPKKIILVFILFIEFCRSNYFILRWKNFMHEKRDFVIIWVFHNTFRNPIQMSQKKKNGLIIYHRIFI